MRYTLSPENEEALREDLYDREMRYPDKAELRSRRLAACDHYDNPDHLCCYDVHPKVRAGVRVDGTVVYGPKRKHVSDEVRAMILARAGGFCAYQVHENCPSRKLRDRDGYVVEEPKMLEVHCSSYDCVHQGMVGCLAAQMDHAIAFKHGGLRRPGQLLALLRRQLRQLQQQQGRSGACRLWRGTLPRRRAARQRRVPDRKAALAASPGAECWGPGRKAAGAWLWLQMSPCVLRHLPLANAHATCL